MSEDSELIVRFDVVIEYKGQKILDPKIAILFKVLKEKGSILGTSRVTGIPYSKLYDIIARIERLTGKKIIEARRGGRGGGGVVLTEFGEKLLSLYEIAWTKLAEAGLATHSQHISRRYDIAIAHSHDPLLSILFSSLSRTGINIHSMCLGSGASLAMLSLELVDVACIHLYDLETKTYNKPFLERFWISDRVEHIGGYMREIVFAYKPDLYLNSIEDIMMGLLRGELVIASRNKGSGTRILLDALLKDYAKKYGHDLNNVIRGIDRELYTHDDVAKHIKQGKADVGLTIRYIAEKHGLRYIHVTWEYFECYALKLRMNNAINKLHTTLLSKEFNQFLNNIPGYRSLYT